MLFVLFIILSIIAIIAKIWTGRNFEYEWPDIAAVTCAILSVAAVVISILVFIFSFTGLDGYVAAMNERRESLVYQYENDIYDNDNDVGKRELMVDIQSWNEDLASSKENQDDFWIGIYIPNIYDQFEFIELEG